MSVATTESENNASAPEISQPKAKRAPTKKAKPAKKASRAKKPATKPKGDRANKEEAPKVISGKDIAFDRSLDDIVISQDGRTLAAAMQDESVYLLPIDGGDARSVPGVKGLTPVAFCGDGSLLVYHSGEMPARILRVDPTTGRQAPWKELTPNLRAALWEIQPIRVASDCESYAFSAQYLPETVHALREVPAQWFVPHPLRQMVR